MTGQTPQSESKHIPFEWLSEFLARLEDEHIFMRGPKLQEKLQDLHPAHILRVDPEDWGRAAEQAAKAGLRWCAIWAEDLGEIFRINSCLEKHGDYLVLRTRVNAATPVLPSYTRHYPAADRAERHIQDMFGIRFADHPDPRCWTRHLAWPNTEFPLRKSFPVAGNPPELTPPHADYPFLQAQGAGVYEIPVGPIHAGIIEPGHFRFQAVGEMVLNLEERLGYVHKGVEKIAEGRDPWGLARLAGRVSGDSTVAHTWAACMAMERAARVEVPPRALALRAVMAERERVANHLGDIGAICNDVGFAFAYYQFGRLREQWQRVSAQAFGHRFMMDCIVPGGVRNDVAPDAVRIMLDQTAQLRRELDELLPILDDSASLEDRLQTTGILSVELAAQLGCVGYVGRASGRAFDLRRDAPYPPYDGLTVTVPEFTAGDVEARMLVRAKEIETSLDLIAKLLQSLPMGQLTASWVTPSADAEGLGLVEGWRGETLAYVRFDENGTIARYFPRDPSWLNWPALEKLIRDNIVPDFPVCNKSVNGSYSGHDL
ncbi:MAG: NADH-quinone oxidoreductase subunit C [Gammaproteobacteria bacterium]